MTFRALLVGNWLYESPEGGMPPLRAPRHDVRRLKEALTDPRFGLFKEADVDVRENLTGLQLSDALFGAANDSQPDDVLLIYYSGHGERLGQDQRLGLVGVDVPYANRANRALHTRQLSEWLGTLGPARPSWCSTAATPGSTEPASWWTTTS